MGRHMSLTLTYISHLSEALFLYILNVAAAFSVSLTVLMCCVCVQVTGEANENQVCEALRRYRDRECFTREALIHLYNLITDIDTPRPDMLKVLPLALCLLCEASVWCSPTILMIYESVFFFFSEKSLDYLKKDTQKCTYFCFKCCCFHRLK